MNDICADQCKTPASVTSSTTSADMYCSMAMTEPCVSSVSPREQAGRSLPAALHGRGLSHHQLAGPLSQGPQRCRLSTIRSHETLVQPWLQRRRLSDHRTCLLQVLALSRMPCSLPRHSDAVGQPLAHTPHIMSFKTGRSSHGPCLPLVHHPETDQPGLKDRRI